MKITSKVISIQHKLADEEGHKYFMSEVKFLPMSTSKTRFFVVIEVNSCNDDSKIYKVTTQKTASDATAKSLLADKLIEYVAWRQRERGERAKEIMAEVAEEVFEEIVVKTLAHEVKIVTVEKKVEDEEEVQDPAFASGGR